MWREACSDSEMRSENRKADATQDAMLRGECTTCCGRALGTQYCVQPLAVLASLLQTVAWAGA